MGAEIFKVSILLDDVEMLYATKCEFKKNTDNNTTVTFNGDVTTGAKNTGATISLEGLSYPTDLDEALLLQEKLEEGKIDTITCSGTSYTFGGLPYRRTITGSGVTITSDEESWSPTDGVTSTLEFKVDTLTRLKPEATNVE